jgi:HPt (histidine-containing phosphotransfer) domain-containing protein
VEALQSATVAGDAEAIRGCAHRLHGLLRMIEAEAACAAAAALERSAQRGQVPAEALAEALAAAIAELRDELSRAGDRPQNLAPAHNEEFPRAI